MTSIIDDAVEQKEKKKSAYPKSIYISRNLQELSHGMKSNTVSDSQSFFKFARAYQKEKSPKTTNSGSGVIPMADPIFKKFNYWIKRKFTKVGDYWWKFGTVKETPLSEWKIESGMEAYRELIHKKKVDFHYWLRRKWHNSWDGGWINHDKHSMMKWAWNLRRTDRKKDKEFPEGEPFETDATVPKAGDVIVVGGHSSVIKGFLTDDNLDWSHVSPSNENLYTKLVHENLELLATKDENGKWEINADFEEGLDPARALKDLTDNKLLNCQAVYLKMEVSGSYENTKIKVKEWTPVYTPQQNEWT